MIKIGAHGILLEKEEEKEQVTRKGIIIPTTKKTTHKKGKVKIAGRGTPEKPMEVRVGEKVYYNVHSAREIEIDGVEYDLIDSGDCLYIEV